MRIGRGPDLFEAAACPDVSALCQALVRMRKIARPHFFDEWINEPGPDGRTVLHVATRYGHEAHVVLLLSQGARVLNVKADVHGETPLSASQALLWRAGMDPTQHGAMRTAFVIHQNMLNALKHSACHLDATDPRVQIVAQRAIFLDSWDTLATLMDQCGPNLCQNESIRLLPWNTQCMEGLKRRVRLSRLAQMDRHEETQIV